MRIAILVYCLEGGGVQRQTLTLAKAFASRGGTVEYIVVRATGELLGNVPTGVNLVTLLPTAAPITLPRSIDQIIALWKLARYLRRTQPSALLSGGTHVNALAVIAHWMSGVRARLILRVTNHMSRSQGKVTLFRRVSAAVASLLYPRADCVVAVSDAVRRDLLAVTTLAPDRVVTIREPVVTPAIKTLATEDPGHAWLQESAIPVILAAGRLSLQKDFETLVRAFALVRQKRDARLVIIGSTGDRAYTQRLRECIQDCGVADSVDLAGYASNPFSFMARVSVFAISSLWEGCPNVLAEAIHCGCIVVATDCPGGVREVVDEGTYGLVVPTSDPAALAAALCRALDSKPAYSRFEHCPEGFDVDTSVRRYLSYIGGEQIPHTVANDAHCLAVK